MATLIMLCGCLPGSHAVSRQPIVAWCMAWDATTSACWGLHAAGGGYCSGLRPFFEGHFCEAGQAAWALLQAQGRLNLQGISSS